MNIKRFSVKAAVFALALSVMLCSAPESGLPARADSPVASSYSAELGAGGLVFFPAVALPSGWHYSVSLYETGDAGFVSPLAEGLFYNFPDTGEYVLRYLVIDGALNAAYYTAAFFVVDLTPPVMIFPLDAYAGEYSFNQEIPLLAPALTDNNANGNPAYGVSVELFGADVETPGGVLTLSALGDYVITYTAQDKSGNTASRSFTVRNTGIDTLEPAITVNGQYAAVYPLGSSVQIIAASVSDNSGENITPVVTAILNGSALPVINGCIALTAIGSCTVIYEAADSSGNLSSLTVTFSVARPESGKPPAKGCRAGCIAGGVGGGAGGALLLAAGIFLTVRLLKKRRNGKDEAAA